MCAIGAALETDMDSLRAIGGLVRDVGAGIKDESEDDGESDHESESSGEE